MPGVHGAKLASKGVAAQRTLRKTTAKDASKIVAFETRAVASMQKLTKANVARASADPGDVQQWVVLTEWEQVQTTSRRGPLTSDYDAQQSGDAATNGDAKAPAPTDQVTNQVTITRLILRVIPASSLSTQPAMEQFRSGWFVFQL
jgi:hypothetical protein